METRSHLTNISSTSALGCILKHPELVPTERKSVKYYDNQVWVYLHHISLQRRSVFNATQFQNQQKGVGLFLFKHYIHNFIFFSLKFQNKEECLKNIQTKKKWLGLSAFEYYITVHLYWQCQISTNVAYTGRPVRWELLNFLSYHKMYCGKCQ